MPLSEKAIAGFYGIGRLRLRCAGASSHFLRLMYALNLIALEEPTRDFGRVVQPPDTAKIL
jgi:hypothetical protein